VNLPDNTISVGLDNQTDGDVQVSMDGGASDTYHMSSGSTLTIPLGQLARKTTAIVQAKRGTSVPGSGSFYVYSVS
jgi:hypothetical protein